jgi:hypothetical protein
LQPIPATDSITSVNRFTVPMEIGKPGRYQTT